MNHLHEVFESIKSRSCTVQKSIPAGSDISLANNFFRMSKQAVCFDAGDGMDVAGLKGSAELIRLPFNACWIEFIVERTIIAAMCEQTANPRIFNMMPFSRKRGENWHMMDVMAVDASSDLVRYLTVPENHEWYKAVGGVVIRFLCALNCSNVKRIESTPPIALNKSRIRRGKQPLFSTWTLSISLPKERRDSVALGGSHASPRVHLRRGHPREYKPGSWTWVQPCAVGAKENGMIHKDYKAICKTEK